MVVLFDNACMCLHPRVRGLEAEEGHAAPPLSDPHAFVAVSWHGCHKTIHVYQTSKNASSRTGSLKHWTCFRRTLWSHLAGTQNHADSRHTDTLTRAHEPRSSRASCPYDSVFQKHAKDGHVENVADASWAQLRNNVYRAAPFFSDFIFSG
jgi:hypothetical protein